MGVDECHLGWIYDPLLRGTLVRRLGTAFSFCMAYVDKPFPDDRGHILQADVDTRSGDCLDFHGDGRQKPVRDHWAIDRCKPNIRFPPIPVMTAFDPLRTLECYEVVQPTDCCHLALVETNADVSGSPASVIRVEGFFSSKLPAHADVGQRHRQIRKATVA